MKEICVHLMVDEDTILREVKDTGVTTLEEAIRQELNWLRNSGMTVKDWSFEKELHSFYFTFGTTDTQPYQRGWVEVLAEDKEQATEIYRSKYPDHTPGVVNCSSIYDKESFDIIHNKYYRNDPSWNICHETLRADTIRTNLSKDENIKDVVALVCIHETKYGNDIYLSLHPNSKEALAHVDAVKVECEFDEEGYREYFDSDIHFLQIDTSQLHTHKGPALENQAKPSLSQQITSAQEKQDDPSFIPISPAPQR